MSAINEPLILPCGAILKNRIAKSAMSENMGTSDHKANDKFARLYSRWAEGGAGLLITGNIMVDRHALGEPGNVVFEEGRNYSDLKAWTKAGTKNGTHLWTQINHPGKQSPKFLSKTPVSPSAIEFKAPLNKMFNRPRALTEAEIQKIIRGFAHAAFTSRDSGFTGTQIHGAHGYLVSQFLSPLHNQRTDHWGGSLENRMRFVVEIYKAMRDAVGPSFPMGIKLNSADFMKGGFTQEESMIVVETLSGLGMDLIEISGGTYESPEMTGARRKETTKRREAYFLEYCEEVRSRVKSPLMLTGGFRSADGMKAALATGACDVIGLGRSLVINPSFPLEIFSGQNAKSLVKPLTTGVKAIDKIVPLEITWYSYQLQRMGAGRDPLPNLSAVSSIIRTMLTIGVQNLKRVRS